MNEWYIAQQEVRDLLIRGYNSKSKGLGRLWAAITAHLKWMEEDE